MHPGELYAFMENMLEAGFSPKFTMGQGFQYALQYQREQSWLHKYGTNVQISCEQMERAALWVGGCASALGIHPVQLENEREAFGRCRAR